MAIYLRPEHFKPAEELRAHEEQMLGASQGARVDFTGFLRDNNQGRQVLSMYLEHYPGMTESHLQTVCTEARAKWNLLDALVVHRVGLVLPAQPIVLVSTWASHRADAFDSCRYLITELKHRAPFWKKETTDQGEFWVASNTEDPGVNSSAI